MKKITLEIDRDENFPAGYGKTSYINENSDIVLDKLIEWSRENKHTIYRHKINYTQEKEGELGLYEFDNHWINHDHNLKISKCHLVCYLTIYYQ